MIWSEQELARLAVCKDDVIADKVFSHLSEPENQDIWQKENFSLLYGLLGVAGVKGMTSDSADRVWIILNDNKALEAYDKGILDDFNRRITQQHHDERMRGWINLDNYTAGLKFRKTILLPLTKLSDKIRTEVDINFPNPEKVIERFAYSGDKDRLKTYLESVKPITNDEALFGIDVIFDKEQSLKKLSRAVAYATRQFTEAERDYLWHYFFDALDKGFLPEKIGMTDNFVARLVAEPADKNKSELDKTLLQSRNDSICEFLQTVENPDNFYEETASKLVLFNPDELGKTVEKCLDFAKLSANPRGVVLALSLINLKQIKSAVTILLALAEKGVVTEACAFMHRLLPLAKGGESVILSLLKTNLVKLKERSVLAKNEAYQAYVSRYYLLAAKAFVEVGCFKECAELLKFSLEEAWFAPKSALADDFKMLANYLLSLDKQEVTLLEPVIGKIGFTVFYDNEAVFIGEGTDNPLTQARHRVEQSIKDVTTFDVSGVFDKVATVENSAYNALKSLKKTLNKSEETPERPDSHVTTMPEDVPLNVEETKPVENVVQTEQKAAENSLTSPLEEITHWEEPADHSKEHDESIVGGLKRFKSKISDKVNLDIDSILKVSALDIDKHFEKIKQVADNALNQAKEQMNEVKGKVEKLDVSKVPSMDKVKDFAKKFQIKRKKDE